MSSANIYIFGYGSLQNINSIRNTLNVITHIDETQFAVRVKNMRRGWYLSINKNNLITSPWTTLACVEEDGYSVNGVLIQITPECLRILDERETEYIRKIIPHNQINSICNKELCSDSIVYYYGIEPDSKQTPTFRAPILQSYLDTCLIGCIEIDAKLGNMQYEYTVEFLQTTYEWNAMYHWVNDRIFPRRPYEHVPNARIIDQLLHLYILS
jgi:hypothetical protein